MTDPIQVVVHPVAEDDFRVGIPAFQINIEEQRRAGLYSEHCVDSHDWENQEGYILISDLRKGDFALDLGVERGEKCDLVFEGERYEDLIYAGSWTEHEIPSHRFQFHELEDDE
jgi:hypothetical protein